MIHCRTRLWRVPFPQPRQRAKNLPLPERERGLEEAVQLCGWLTRYWKIDRVLDSCWMRLACSSANDTLHDVALQYVMLQKWSCNPTFREIKCYLAVILFHYFLSAFIFGIAGDGLLSVIRVLMSWSEWSLVPICSMQCVVTCECCVVSEQVWYHLPSFKIVDQSRAWIKSAYSIFD